MLFVKLNLNVPVNTVNTRQHLSTNNAVLKQLKHPVAAKIIKWRKLQNSHLVKNFIFLYLKINF